MSIEAINWAKTVNAGSPTSKLVLMMLAVHHHPINGCFPSQSLLMSETHLSERAVREAIKRLADAGLLRVEKVVRNSVYHLNMNRQEMPVKPAGDAGTYRQEVPPISKEEKKMKNTHTQNPRSKGTNPKAKGTNPRAKGTNQRSTGTNPRALRTNPRAVRDQTETDLFGEPIPSPEPSAPAFDAFWDRVPVPRTGPRNQKLVFKVDKAESEKQWKRLKPEEKIAAFENVAKWYDFWVETHPYGTTPLSPCRYLKRRKWIELEEIGVGSNEVLKDIDLNDPQFQRPGVIVFRSQDVSKIHGGKGAYYRWHEVKEKWVQMYTPDGWTDSGRKVGVAANA